MSERNDNNLDKFDEQKAIIKKQNNAIISLSVFLGVFVITTVVFFILWLIYYMVKNTLFDATYSAAYNTNTCKVYSERCDVPSSNVDPPTIDLENDPPEFQKEFALFCAKQVIAVEYPEDQPLSPGLTLVKKIITTEVNAPVFGYVAVDSSKSYIYILFRGITTDLEWSEDLTLNQRTVSLSQVMNLPKKRKDIQKSFTANGLCTDNVLIQSGFGDIFDQIKEQVADAVAEIVSSNNAIIVAGHSLGGAIASLISIYLKSLHPSMPVTTYTFGKPRVGNIEYADCVNNNINGFYRIENLDDIITTLPPSVSPNINDYNDPFIYQHEGTLVYYQSNWGSWTLNHSLQNSITYLQTI